MYLFIYFLGGGGGGNQVTHLCGLRDHEGAEADDDCEGDLRQRVVNDVSQGERTEHSQHYANHGTCKKSSHVVHAFGDAKNAPKNVKM